MTVGGPGRLLPAGGGEDGRFPEGAPGVQQEQLQQIPCGFRLQGFQPPPLGVFAHQRIPVGTDYRDREDQHPPALPPPAVGQKECGQEAGPGAGGAGGGELGPAPENRPDREPGHDRGHLKFPEFPEFPRLFPLFSPPSPRWEFLGSALFIWDSPLSRFLGSRGFGGEGETDSQNSQKFSRDSRVLFPVSSWSSWVLSPVRSRNSSFPNFLFFLEFPGFIPCAVLESLIPKIPIFPGILS